MESSQGSVNELHPASDLQSHDHESYDAPSTTTIIEQKVMRSDRITEAIEALSKSREDFERCASVADQQELASSHQELAKLLEVAQIAQSNAAHAATAGPWRKLKSSYGRFSETSFRFAKHLDAVAIIAPAYVQAAWGAIHLLLVAQINHHRIKDCIVTQIARIEREMSYLPAMTSYAPTAAAIAALTNVYTAYLTFLREAIRLYSKSRIKKIINSFRPVETTLHPLVEDICVAARHVKQLGKVAMLRTVSDTAREMREMKQTLEQLQGSLSLHELSLSDNANISNIVARMADIFFERSETLTARRQPQQENSPSANGVSVGGEQRQEECSSNSILDELDSLRDTISLDLPRHAATLAIVTNSENVHQEDPLLHAEIELLTSWLESDGSGVLWIEGQGAYQHLLWNVALVDGIVADVVKSCPSSATLRFYCSSPEAVSMGNSPAAIIQLFVIQLLGQHKDSLGGKDLPPRENLIRAARDFSLGWQLLLDCLSLCSVRNLVILVDRIDQSCSSPAQTDAAAEFGTPQDLVKHIGELSNEPGLIFKAIFTADKAPGGEYSASDFTESTNLPGMAEFQLVPWEASFTPRTPALDKYEEALRRYLEISANKTKAVSFPELWMIYRPNTVVYTKDLDDWRALVVVDIVRTTGSDELTSRIAPVTLRCWRMKLHKGKVARVIERCEIEYFSGSRMVQDLKYIPSLLAPSNASVASRLAERGALFCRYSSGYHYLELRGPYAEKRSNDGVCRVMIDNIRHYEEFGTLGSTVEETAESTPLKTADHGHNTQFKPVVLMTCPRDIPAYDLKNNLWIEVDLNDLHEIPRCSQGMISTLNLRNQSEDTLTDTARYYLDGRKVFKSTRYYNESEYLTRNVGMLTLLHGPPSSGMTYTVEVLAEVFARPVVRILGSIINEDQASQKRLRSIFESAHRWNAVILMKDVDIFFHEYDGSATDIARASLSSLVRELVEGFTGMLYVVTHRVRMFDPTHYSLFAVNVEFEPWSAERRYAMLKTLLEQVGYDENADDWLEVDNWLREELARDETLDIRKMRNLVAVAAIRAKAGGETLRKFELKHAARMNSNFGTLMVNQRLARGDMRR